MYVVAGVSGHTGSVVASGLLDAGKKVRVIVRDAKKGEPWKQRGAEVAVGELSDGAFVARALAGAEAAYLLAPAPSNPVGFRANQRKIVDGLVHGVTESKLPRLVLLSSIGADKESGTGPIEALGYAERKLRPLATRSVFLRACSFMENHGSAVGPAVKEGKLYSFGAAEHAHDQIATKDIGKLALQALLSPPAATEFRQIAGPRTYSAADAAAAFGKALNKKIEVTVLPAEAAAGAFKGMGMPPEMADAFGEMISAMGKGHIAFDPKLPILRGTTTLDEVIGTLVKSVR